MADPGFLRGGLIYYLHNFYWKLHENENFGLRRGSHLPQLISSLTYAVYPWSVHCERASARCRNSDRVNVILFVVSNSKCHVIHKFPRICEWRVVDNVLFMTLLTTLLTTLSTAVLMTVTTVYNDIINDIKELSHITKFSPIFYFKISACYSASYCLALC